jgi:hypothetical protein
MTTDALIDSIRTAIDDGASDEARAAGATACRSLLAVLEPRPAEPIAPSAPVPQAPRLPIAAIAQAIRNVPPDQLADMLIAKLRTLVPPEGQIASVRRFNIPLAKVPTP